MRIFERSIFWLVLKLEISHKVEGFWFFLEDFFGRLYFCMVKYLSFHNSSFALKIMFNVNGEVTLCDTPLV
jgi:hypothetical protein